MGWPVDGLAGTDWFNDDSFLASWCWPSTIKGPRRQLEGLVTVAVWQDGFFLALIVFGVSQRCRQHDDAGVSYWWTGGLLNNNNNNRHSHVLTPFHRIQLIPTALHYTTLHPDQRR